jgi:hypothetical protein
MNDERNGPARRRSVTCRGDELSDGHASLLRKCRRRFGGREGEAKADEMCGSQEFLP